MVYPSGEVETGDSVPRGLHACPGSGWFIHPGKLKRGWLGWWVIKSAPGSGWFIHPGKLKRRAAGGRVRRSRGVPDGLSIRGS